MMGSLWVESPPNTSLIDDRHYSHPFNIFCQRN